jgi:hydrogenase maturation factor
MCQSPVGKVVLVGKDKIKVEHKGQIKELDSRLVKVKKGDYVLFSANMAIDKVDEEEAKMILGQI